MSSITISAAVFGCFTLAAMWNHPHTMRTSMLNHPQNTARGGVTVKAMKVPESGDHTVQESRSKRRDLIFTAAVATACSIAKIGMAEEEPKQGTEEAKKKYAPVCVTMPTARISFSNLFKYGNKAHPFSNTALTRFNMLGIPLSASVIASGYIGKAVLTH